MNIRDLVNDFANDEFVQKNVRVRPVSSLSHHQGNAKNEDVGKSATIEDEEDKKLSRPLFGGSHMFL